MGLKVCQIRFDNPYKTYYVGQTINGTVEMVFDSPKTVRGIAICLKGEANTSWSVATPSATTQRDSQGNPIRTEPIMLQAHEEYFKIEYYILGSKSGNEITIPAGMQSYPFSCMLPPTLPSSFEGEFGHVRYTLKVTLDRPWKFDQEIKDAFTVLSPLDLNSLPRLKEPYHKEFEKFFCCCWCKSGPLTFTISIPQTGFAPGQVIPILCELDNISNVGVDSVQFILNKIIIYHAQKETKRQIVVVTQVQADAVLAHESKTWNQPIAIPPLPPSNLANCTVIDLAYELQVEACVSGLHANLICIVPITIGTQPLASNMDDQQYRSGEPSVAIDMNTQQPPNYAQLQNANNGGGFYPNVGNISFEPAKYGTASIHDGGDNQYTRYPDNNQQYTPMYPVYSFNQLNQS